MAKGFSEALGLIAGQGALPFEVVRSAQRRGRRVAAVAFHGLADPGLGETGAELTWLHPGEVQAALDALHAAGVREAVMVGKVPKAGLISGPAVFKPDALALELLALLRDRRDDSILGGLAAFLESRGIHLLPQLEVLPDLVGPAGVLGAVAPSPEQRADVAFGFPIAKAIAGLDVGQTVVVKDRAVLAVEAIEGTDEAVLRAGRIAAGASVVKVAKPRQDPRFDVPAIGPGTLSAMLEAKAGLLAFEAGRTLVIDREALLRQAEAAGVVLYGVAEGSLP